MKTGMYIVLTAVILTSVALTGCQKDEDPVETVQPDPGKAKPKDHPAH